jgi:hypothetical protein
LSDFNNSSNSTNSFDQICAFNLVLIPKVRGRDNPTELILHELHDGLLVPGCIKLLTTDRSGGLLIELTLAGSIMFDVAPSFSIQSCRSCYATQHLCQRPFYKILVQFRNSKKNVLKIVLIIVNINKDENKSLISNQFSLKMICDRF